MSVLIKGMEMPKDCVSCRWHARWGCEITHRVTNVAQRCPLVEVPTPHGRLTDTDKLINTLQGLFNKREEEARFTGNREVPVTWNDAIYFIKIAPTIIEAEEDSHE